MIDLSHLSEEEQANILKVLQRDTELRKVEESRVRQLQIKNEIQRKNMTGEWFYKAKAKRHRDTLHGAELIQASMRKKKPMTIYDRLQSMELKEKSNSLLKNAGNGIFIPPELTFFLQAPKVEEPRASTTLRKENRAHPQQQQMPRKTNSSSAKQRENPFNKSSLSADYPNEERLPLPDGNQSPTIQESLSHPKDNISRLHFPSNEQSPAENISEIHPVPKPRTLTSRLQGSSDYVSIMSGSKNGNGLNGNASTPKSILKRSPSSSSNDSEILRIGVQESKNKVPASQTIPEGATVPTEATMNEESLANNSLEKLKQVRFSTKVDEKRISQIQENSDANKISKIGEDNILDTDYMGEINEGKTDDMDSVEENGSLQEDSGVSDLHHLPPLQTDFVYLNREEVNAVPDTDFQSLQTTNSNPKKYSDSHSPSYSSNELTNHVHELDTGEILTEKEPDRRLNSTSNPSYHIIDKRILHTDFESPQVSDQQFPEIFQGGSRLIEENDISQEKLDRFELSDSPIQTFLNPTDTSLQEEEISLIKSDKEAIYDEVPGVDLNENKRDFELHDEFEPKLNLQSGITRTSTFKESEDGSTEMPTEIHKSEMPYDSEQEAKHISSNHWGGNDQMHVESRGSLSEDEMPTMSWKMNPHASDTYKSLQDLNAIDSMPSTLDLKKKEMILSAHDVSAIPVSPENTPLQSKKMKRLSQSVPALAENDDADSRSERSFQMNKHGTIASSLTNISSSSGMTSRSSVGSIMSIYSDDFGNIDVRGKIQFSLDYVDKLKEFHIFVVRCSDLAAADEKKNRSDPYVKSYLLPDKVKMGKKKTTVMKKTLNPIYNEILRYKVEKDVLMAQTLNLSVWHNDTFGRNNFLGEIDVELEKWNWTNKQMEWYNLKPRAISAYTMGNRGTLKVALRYIPKGQRGKKTGEVQIWVKEANNLPQVRVHRLDPFVKCFILPDTSRKSRQKSRVVKKNRNPNFNHTMVYDGFGPEDLKEACVELSVWDHDKLVNHFLGGLRIGLGTGKSYGMAVDWMDSTEEEKIIWNKMITNPNIWVEDVLPLRMLMLSKTVTN
ncbi:synaptotagmin-like protein 2 isoform X4 [Amblyraja radiata]|uniref:synaptotagmin-like protein 2 isoform X4 n=1 Tax=Amblyraja radiata TaxID=386614 RepID=UPI001402941D|nr:synaptotagmin-like protein 2 isoform X4 [Amblyraja radiata]